MSCKGQKAEMIESVIVMEGVGRKQGEAEGGEGKKKTGAKKAVTDMGMVRYLEVRRRIRDY